MSVTHMAEQKIRCPLPALQIVNWDICAQNKEVWRGWMVVINSMYHLV